ncbi:MAG: sigma-70 family RNA polymerase sigma factor [Rhizobacter sp.]
MVDMLAHAPSIETGIADVAQCVARTHARLLRFAKTQLRNAALAEDAVSETVLAALNTSNAFATESQVVAWLFGVLRHKLVDQLRHLGREIPSSEGLVDSDGNACAATNHALWGRGDVSWHDPEHILRQREFVELVKRCCAHLPRLQSEAFVMYELHELDASTICGRLNIRRGHLWVLLYRARAALRLLLMREWGAEFV